MGVGMMPLAQQLGLEVAQSARAIARDLHFNDAYLAFCTQLPAVFQKEPRLVRALGDVGRFVVVAAGFAAKPARSITLAEITTLARAGNFASARRVRAIVEQFIDTGVVRRNLDVQDSRCRPLTFNGWMEAAMQGWVRAYITPALPWINKPPTVVLSEIDYIRVFLNHSLTAYQNSGFYLSKAYPDVHFFMQRHIGYLLLLHILSHAPPLATRLSTQPAERLAIPFSHKQFAKFYTSNRAHSAHILSHAQQQGLLERDPARGQVYVSRRQLARWQEWVAHELAWTARAFNRASF
jgi:hypothetical protein